MHAELVYDGEELIIPERMGVPREDQMRGTDAERLIELCGRVCYDSLGKGRASGEYHQHINETRNHSVCEHFNITIEIVDRMATNFAVTLLNRPGTYAWYPSVDTIRITLNPRCLIEWEGFGRHNDTMLFGTLLRHMEPLVPSYAPVPLAAFSTNNARVVEPIIDEERWVSMFMVGSRGFSHEQVRHGDFTAISQRSTRYCDESESEWVPHPLESAFHGHDQHMLDDPFVKGAQERYQQCVAALEPWIKARGVDATTARKQARGAARGYLGNALETEMIFSANVTQWRRMLKQRLHPAADAEIRQVYVHVLDALRSSRYGDRFDDVTTEPSPDGIGVVAKWA